MATLRDLRLLLPRSIRQLPADLAFVVAFVAVTNTVVFVPILNETVLRIGFGLGFVLFVPGYAFISALFPESASNTHSAPDEDLVQPDQRQGIDGIERVALSFGLSIAIVPLVGLILNFTPFGIRLEPIMVSLSVLTLVLVGIGATRRRELPESERFRVPYRTWVNAGKSELLDPDSTTDTALNILLVFSILLAAVSVGYAVFVPKQGEAFTELYLLTENEDGELVADNYPQNFTLGEPQQLTVGVGNHEHSQVEYTVVVVIQRVQTRNNSTQVLETNELERHRTQIVDGETNRRQINVQPTMTGTELRLAFLLYRGSPDTQLSTDTAYRSTHLWINVSQS